MSFLDTFSEMIVILFAIGAGYLAHRLGYLGPEVNQKLSKVILNITSPALIISSVAKQETLPDIRELLSVLAVAAVFYTLEFAFAFVVPRLVGGTPKQIGVWRFALCFPNVGYIGFPLVTALFGAKGLFYAVILVLPFNLLNYSLGPLMLSGKIRFNWKQFLTPCIITSVLALVIALCRIRLPHMIGEMAALVGDVTIPLSLLVLGALLAGLPAGQVFASGRLWALSAVRLLVLPAVLSFLLRLLTADPFVMSIAVLQIAMPVAVNGSMLCLEFGGDEETMARITFLTTLLSIITLPVVAAVFL